LKSILASFSKILSESTSREQQKKLLHMPISEIMNKEEGVSIAGIPSYFSLKNVGLSMKDLDIAI
jgi:site-specific DNA recombinase